MRPTAIARRIAHDTQSAVNRDWDRAQQDTDNRGYSDGDRPRHRVKVCFEYDNGDEYRRYKE